MLLGGPELTLEEPGPFLFLAPSPMGGGTHADLSPAPKTPDRLKGRALLSGAPWGLQLFPATPFPSVTSVTVTTPTPTPTPGSGPLFVILL